MELGDLSFRKSNDIEAGRLLPLLDQIVRVRKGSPSSDMADICDALERVISDRLAAARAADTADYTRALWHR